MTHNADCTVREDARPFVDDVAEHFAESRVAGKEAAKALGWEFIGSGAGRYVFRVDDETHDQTCIVKFAVGRGTTGGASQNRSEIEQFEDFPAAVVDADPPIVVPVRDYDPDTYRWLTAPEVDPRGDVGGAADRLSRAGWHCNDLHHDNVGTMHGEPVILDYGLDCQPTAGAEDLAEEFAASIERFSARNVQINEGAEPNEAHVSFFPPEWASGDDADPRPSGVTFVAGVESGARNGRFVFGPWDTASPDPDLLDRVVDEIEDWWGLHVEPYWNDAGEDGVSAVFDVDFMWAGGEWPPEIVADVYDDFLDEIDVVIEGVYQPAETASEIRTAIRNWAVDVETTTDALGGEVTFYPPQEDGGRINPGLERPSERSGVRFSTTGVTEIRYTVGPWRHGEPRRPTVGEGAENVVDFIESDEVEATWRKIGHEHDEYGKVVEVTFTLTPGEDVEDGGWAPDDARPILTALPIEVSNRLPRAREAGEPVQQPLDEFAMLPAVESAIDAAAVSAGIDGAIRDAVGDRPG